MAELTPEERGNQDGRRALSRALAGALGRAAGQGYASGEVSSRCRRALDRGLARLPALTGEPVRIRFQPGLRARHGRLVSGGTRGEEVHAGSQLRKREMVLDAALLAHPAELTRIFLHELFHFIWLRAGNQVRSSWEALLRAETRGRARGELGWSAEGRRNKLTVRDRTSRSRRWREYACESFCDSAAWLLGPSRAHEEFTLAPRFRAARQRWFRSFLSRGGLSI